MSYMSYRFKCLKDGAVYLGTTRNSEAGLFVVILDGVQTKIDGFSKSNDPNCAITWSKTGLDAGFHNLTVSFLSRSPQAPDGNSGSLELNNFQLVAEDKTGIPGSSNSGSVSPMAEVSSAFFAGLFGTLLLQAI